MEKESIQEHEPTMADRPIYNKVEDEEREGREKREERKEDEEREDCPALDWEALRRTRNTMGWIVALIISLIIGLVVASCDVHRDFPDTGLKVGHVLCTDGVTLPLSDYAESGKEAIGVVFFVNTDPDIEGRGYAVYLQDIATEAFADSLGVAQGTSADIAALDGNANTFAIYATRDIGSPMALAVFDMWRYGQSAYIPSVAQMRLLFSTKDAVNTIIAALGGDPLPDAADDCWYWTSTEVSGQQTAKAWLYSLGSGAMQETPKDQFHKIRPIITINE